MFPYLIPIAVLSQITVTKVGRLRKMYEPILANDCIPLAEIPFTQQETFARDYLLRDCYVDIDLMQCTRDDTDWEAICLKFKRHEESDLSELATVIIDRDILRQSSRLQMKK